MKRFIGILLIFCLATFLSGADQPDFPDIYVDAGCAGTHVGSLANPYDDLSDINWTTAGDNSIFDYLAGAPAQSPTIHLNKGDIWREMLSIGTSGTGAFSIIIEPYGAGADPIITATDDMMGVLGDWTDTGGNVWKRAEGAEVKNVVFDTTQFGIENNPPAAQYEWDWVANELFVFSVGNPTLGYYTTIEGGQRASCIQNFEKDYIEIDGINCYGANGTHGVFVRGSSYVTIRNCNIHQNNSKQINASVNNVSDSNLTIHNNTFGNNSTDSHGIHVYQLGTGTWTYITISDNIGSDVQDRGICINGVNPATRMDGSNSTISGNTVSGCGDGLYLLYVDDITVSGNTFHTNDDATGVGELYGIGVLECDGCIFEYNHLYSNNGEGMELSSEGGGSGCNGNIIRYNSIHDNSRDGGIKISNGMGTGANEIYYNLIYNHSSGGDAALYIRDPGHKIYNNTLYDNDRGLFIYNADGDNIEFKNNIIANTGTTHVRCVAGTTGLAINYNQYDDDTGTKFHWAGTDYNYANWKTNSGQDANSPDIANPRLINPPIDLRLLMASPCINIGTNVGLTRDYRGRSIRHAPDIGAYEDPTNTLFFNPIARRR